MTDSTFTTSASSASTPIAQHQHEQWVGQALQAPPQIPALQAPPQIPSLTSSASSVSTAFIPGVAAMESAFSPLESPFPIPEPEVEEEYSEMPDETWKKLAVKVTIESAKMSSFTGITPSNKQIHK